MFVDKSLLIDDIIKAGCTILLARPRHWGKTTNLDMIHKFFQIEVDRQGVLLPRDQQVNHKLFLGGELEYKGRKKTLRRLKIANIREYMNFYQGKFPIIRLNLENVVGHSYEAIKEAFVRQIRVAFGQHLYLKNYYESAAANGQDLLLSSNRDEFAKYTGGGSLDETDIHYSVRVLCRLLREHFQQDVHILIDGYDTPMNNAYEKLGGQSEQFERVRDLFERFYMRTLKGNEYRAKAVLAGLFRIAKNNVFVTPNNVITSTPFDVQDYPGFDGFSQHEVDELLARVPTISAPAQFMSWYNGYNYGTKVIYCPWSVTQYLVHGGVINNYWTDVGNTMFVNEVFGADLAQFDLQSLLYNNVLYKELYDGALDASGYLYHKVLLFAGYLNAVLDEQDWMNPCHLLIPNQEVKGIFFCRVLGWLLEKLRLETEDYYRLYFDPLVAGHLEAFAKNVQERFEPLKVPDAYRARRKEEFYLDLVGGIMAPLALKYTKSNRQLGEEKCSYTFLPLVAEEEEQVENGVIIVCTVAGKEKDLESIAKAELKRIDESAYRKPEYAHIRNVFKISMVFSGNEMAIEYRIDEVGKS